MANTYYTPSGTPATQSRNRSSSMRDEFGLVEDGFDEVETAIGLKANAANAALTGTTTAENLSTPAVTFPATQTPSSDANTLDDYEEAAGTSGWTPADASGATLSFTSVRAQRVKVGCIVFIQGRLTYPVTANTSAAVLSGLPFAPRDAFQAEASLTIGRSGSAFAINAYIDGSGGTERIRFVRAIGGSAVLNSELSNTTIAFSGWYITT